MITDDSRASPLDRVRVVLVAPSHPGNVGAAARAMLAMGLSRLALVAPSRYPDHEATRRATGATAVLDAARVVDSPMAIGTAEAISLYWLATRPDGHFLAKLCRAWSEALDQFDSSLFSASDITAGATQMVDAMQADLFVALCEIYVAGPPAFEERILAGLRAAGVPRNQIHARGIAPEPPGEISTPCGHC